MNNWYEFETDLGPYFPVLNDCGTGAGGFKPGNTCASRIPKAAFSVAKDIVGVDKGGTPTEQEKYQVRSVLKAHETVMKRKDRASKKNLDRVQSVVAKATALIDPNLLEAATKGNKIMVVSKPDDLPDSIPSREHFVSMLKDSPDLQAAFLGTKDNNRIVVMAEREVVKNATEKEMAHILAHEMAHKVTTGVSTRWDVLKAFASDVWKFRKDEDKGKGRVSRWGYVCDPREILAETFALMSNPSDTTSWGHPTTDFRETFPKTIAAYEKMARDEYGIGVKNWKGMDEPIPSKNRGWFGFGGVK